MTFSKKWFLIATVALVSALGVTLLLIKNPIFSKAESKFVSAYEIGDVGPAGGNIFYVDDFSDHVDFDYLEAAPSGCEGFDVAWAVDAQALNAALKVVTDWKENSIGQGLENSRAMLEVESSFRNTDTATGFADALSCGEKSDWFVPSKDELDLMYKNLAKRDIGEFSGGYYWSSSSYDYGRAWNQPFSEGLTYDGNKDGVFSVRPIRAF